MKQLWLAIGFTAFLFAGALPAFSHQMPFYPYVSNPTTNSIHLSWYRHSHQTKTVVQVGQKVGEYSLKKYEIEGNKPPTIKINGLNPGSRYHYRVVQDGLEFKSSFETQPKRGSQKPFSFLVLGDSGTGWAIQYKVAKQMKKFHPKFVLHTGDVVYKRGSGKFLKKKYLHPYHPIMKNAPFYIVLGNHDYETKRGKEILDVVILPKNSSVLTERYYTFTYGKTQFFALDSNQFLNRGFKGTTQWNWFKGELAKSRAKWKMVFFHHPLYGTGRHREDHHRMRPLESLLSQYGVDIVFNGHDHTYERTKVIKGVQYIVTGGGGAKVHTPRPDHNTAFAKRAHHFVRVYVGQNSLTIRAINQNGLVFDHCILNKGAKSCVRQ